MKAQLHTLMLLSALLPLATAFGQASRPYAFHGQTSIGLDISLGQNPNLPFYRPPIMSRINTRLHYRKHRWEVPVAATFVLPALLADRRQGPLGTPLDVLLLPGHALGIEPCYRGGFTLHLGTHHTRLSKLSAGDIHYAQGIGISYHPGAFKARISTGFTHRAVAGQGMRLMTTAQLGLGNDNSSYLRLNLADARVLPPGNPARSTVISLDYRVLSKAKTLDWNVELARQAQNRALSGAQALILRAGRWRHAFQLRYIDPDFLNLAWFNQVAGHFDMDWRVHRTFLRQRLQLHSYLARRISWVPLSAAWAGWQRHFQLLATFRISKRLHIEGHIDRYKWWSDEGSRFTPPGILQHVKDEGVSLHANLGRLCQHSLSATLGSNLYIDHYNGPSFPNGIQSQQGTTTGLHYQCLSAKGLGLNAGIHALIGAEDPIPPNSPQLVPYGSSYLGANAALLRRRLILIGHAQQSRHAHGSMTEFSISLQGRLSSRLSLQLQASQRAYSGVPTGPATFIRTHLLHRF